ncbi:hypothetical protein KC678_05595 [Candidatus Dojkabacteria bacterium]|uniref:Uncharacterized protein n=1 Tax=Candidatus Dojkabacteria bacterium TaxID=2099670 RepID=A0A955L2I6_9BACT|nr:hypothetical protein [Candidatus Dojkabacteria bacterium]
MYHAILINKQFTDEDFPSTMKVFAEKIDGDWEIFGVEVKDSELEKFVIEVQNEMRPNETWYAHIYNDEEMIVIFKEKIIKVTPHISTWNPIFEYGKSIGIPEEQLDFWPNRFQDELHYFKDK